MQLNKRLSAIVLLQFDKIFQKTDQNKLHLGPKLCWPGHSFLGQVLDISQKSKI